MRSNRNSRMSAASSRASALRMALFEGIAANSDNPSDLSPLGTNGEVWEDGSYRGRERSEGAKARVPGVAHIEGEAIVAVRVLARFGSDGRGAGEIHIAVCFVDANVGTQRAKCAIFFVVPTDLLDMSDCHATGVAPVAQCGFPDDGFCGSLLTVKEDGLHGFRFP